MRRVGGWVGGRTLIDPWYYMQDSVSPTTHQSLCRGQRGWLWGRGVCVSCRGGGCDGGASPISRRKQLALQAGGWVGGWIQI